MKKTTNKKKAAVITREIEPARSYYVARWALSTMPAWQIKELLRERGVPIPKLRDDMLDRLAQHVEDTGAKVTVRIG